jgi:hypothetical protein
MKKDSTGLTSNARLYVILARSSPRAVVFRRGPSKQVLLALWNTVNDKIELGQWFKGRIYERRCDLSPSGELLVYFAGKFKKPFRTWTAVSRPPFLTALALWPKGDGWGGGGEFSSAHKLALNHRRTEMRLAEGFTLPRWLRVEPFGSRSGWGEDEPIWPALLRRNGWKLTSYPKKVISNFEANIHFQFSEPIVWRKANPKSRKLTLQMSILGMAERERGWYKTEHRVHHSSGVEDSLDRSEWADWSHDGDLLFAKNGALYRARREGNQLTPLQKALQVADFSALKFEARESPKDALKWP